MGSPVWNLLRQLTAHAQAAVEVRAGKPPGAQRRRRYEKKF
jgi:hypothetical protein